MKILGIGTISPLWKDVFNNINIEKKNLSIFSESFINESNNFAYKTYSYPNIIYQETYKKINKKKFISTYNYCTKNFTIYNNNLSRFINNFDKYNSTNRFIFIDKLIKKLIHIFHTENFNLVICGSPPHRVYDQIIKDICNHNKVNFIYPDFQYFEEFGCFIKDINHFVGKVNSIKKKPPSKNLEIINKELKIIKERLKNSHTRKRVSLTNKSLTSNSKKLTINQKIKRLFFENESINPINLKFGFPFKHYYFHIFWGHKVNQYGISSARKYYYLNCYNLQKLLKSKYIFFAPSYQPERSTNPDGGIYYEHYYALSLISKNIPKNIIIIYKEHPKCFDKKFKNIIYRDLKYFKKIKDNLKNVYFVREDESSIKLIKHSIFTAGVNGTTGHESAVMNKKYLLFGNAQYENYPNIIKYKSIKSIDEALNQNLKKNYSIKFNKILNKIANLYIIRDYWRFNTKFRYGFKEKYDYPTLIDNFSKDIKKYLIS